MGTSTTSAGSDRGGNGRLAGCFLFTLRGGPWRHGMHRRWAKLSPEERERLRRRLQRRCGTDRAPPDEAPAS